MRKNSCAWVDSCAYSIHSCSYSPTRNYGEVSGPARTGRCSPGNRRGPAATPGGTDGIADRGRPDPCVAPADPAIPPEVSRRQRSASTWSARAVGRANRLPRTITLSAGAVNAGHVTISAPRLVVLPALSKAGVEIQEYIRQPLAARHPVGYDRAFLDSYRPNETFYLSHTEREHLPPSGPAGDPPTNPPAPTPDRY